MVSRYPRGTYDRGLLLSPNQFIDIDHVLGRPTHIPLVCRGGCRWSAGAVGKSLEDKFSGGFVPSSLSGMGCQYEASLSVLDVSEYEYSFVDLITLRALIYLRSQYANF